MFVGVFVCSLDCLLVCSLALIVFGCLFGCLCVCVCVRASVARLDRVCLLLSPPGQARRSLRKQTLPAYKHPLMWPRASVLDWAHGFS